jgi:hypothetical protein
VNAHLHRALLLAGQVSGTSVRILLALGDAGHALPKQEVLDHWLVQDYGSKIVERTLAQLHSKGLVLKSQPFKSTDTCRGCGAGYVMARGLCHPCYDKRQELRLPPYAASWTYYSLDTGDPVRYSDEVASALKLCPPLTADV